MANVAENLDGIAKAIREAYSGNPIPPIRTQLIFQEIDNAYAIQEANTSHWLAEGRRIVGCKIGLTSPAVQKQLGVDQPDFGILFGDMQVQSDKPVAKGRVLQPKIEAEVAFEMARDIVSAHPTAADIAEATAFVMPALEIVGSRIRNWEISIYDTIADNASSALFVLGQDKRPLGDLDLREVTMKMTRNGEVASEGKGAACLDNPLNAVAWLAAELGKRGRPLRAGDIVLSGALGPMVPAKSGDVFEATISGLGSVGARFA
ncbi:2-keto-4-pentenoate hydratase [Tardiphaga sp. OK246]|jgi:2-keto-4-pentenoate hydratase|uniref:2-keto-4-pentenoate hydratase n=1 Tax=Tardiphaga sp. OK246 TaxID=1855307 RepID=UPI000B681893|nr:fumarylacetoacetate hydrolase family protein [Tardiphaga sp. OK246]SNT59610.1 2-keto-4-pentenoate hydratase [Tardiphaga sp. OK246]